MRTLSAFTFKFAADLWPQVLNALVRPLSPCRQF